MKIRNPQPYFDIQSTRAQIQIKSDPVRLKIRSRRAQMRVHRVRPKMKVNWQQVRAQSGLRSPSAQRKYMQQKYRNMALNSISQIGSQYDQIGDIQNTIPGGPEIVARVAFNHMLQQDIPVVDIASMPSSMPEIEWENGDIEIEWEPAQLEMEWEGSVRPEISFTPHTVEIRLISGETIRVSENEAKNIERQGYGKKIDKEV